MNLLTLCSSLLTLLLLTSGAEAVTRYASPSGTGSAPCTTNSSGATACSLATAIGQLQASETLYLRGGTYSVAAGTLVPPSGTVSNPTIIASYQSEVVTFLNSGDPFNFYSGNFHDVKFDGSGGSSSRTVYGMIFDGTGSPSDYDGIAASGASSAYNITLTNFELKNFPMNGITATDNTRGGFRILNCTVHDTGGTRGIYDNAIYIGGNNTTVDGCHIYNVTGAGIQLFPNANNHTIRNNKIHDTTTDGTDTRLQGIVVSGDGDNNQIYNNIVYHLKKASAVHGGIVVSSNMTNTLVYSNTVYDVDGNGGIFFSNGGVSGGGNIVRNNIVYQTGGIVDERGAVTSDHNLTTDPSFTNAAGGDFTLTAKSTTAINQGSALGSSYATDYNGNPRPQGAGWDIGAYEYQGLTITVSITGSNPSCSGFVACTVTTSSIVLSGTTTAATAGAVTFATDRDISGNATWSPGSGWTTDSITLKAGINHITISSTDGSGNLGTATVTVTYAPTFPGNALVAALGFENGSGTSATDSSGNGNTATLLAGASWTTSGRYGNAVSLNGTTQYITVADANSLDLTQGFTLSVWVKPTALHTDYRALIHKNNLPVNSPYELYASVGGYCGAGGIDGATNVNGSVGPYEHACHATPLQINQWTHLAVTYDGTNLRLYKNAVLMTTTPVSGYLEASAGTLAIGASEYGEYFEGVIDEVRVYNVALSLASANNKVFGATCNVEEYTVATASIIGDANCPVVPAVPPPTFKVGAAAAGLKLGASTVFKVGQSP